MLLKSQFNCVSPLSCENNNIFINIIQHLITKHLITKVEMYEDETGYEKREIQKRIAIIS